MSAGLTEVFTNLASTTMNNGGILASGGTSLTVTSGAVFPTTGNFRILIESEIILVTARATNVLTLVRGQEGTSAASHADGQAVTHILTKGAIQAIQQARPVFTNTASATYTMDSTGNPFDVLVLHNKSGAVSYVMPAPTAGRHIEVYDVTGAINTLANNVFFVPSGSEKFNGSAGFALSGTASTYHFTNNSGTVTATASKFQSELAVGMSVQSSTQAGVNYIVTAIASDTSMTVTPVFSGSTTTTANATRTSLTFAANNGKLYFDSDGTDWYATGDGTPTVLTYTASSGGAVAPFIPPQGVKTAVIYGFGGGGGGGSGGSQNAATNTSGGGGGGGSWATWVPITPTPMTSYTVTIGAGGNGGAAAGPGANGNPGLPGTDSILASGGTTLATFGGASGGGGGSTASVEAGGGLSVLKGNAGTTADNLYGIVDTSTLLSVGASDFPGVAQGGAGISASTGLTGARNPTAILASGSSLGGSGGGAGSNSGGGGGGAAGPAGSGGNGSAGTVGAVTAGSSASANTGAGGGGSGAVTNESLASAAGGAGGSGKIVITYTL